MTHTDPEDQDPGLIASRDRCRQKQAAIDEYNNLPSVRNVTAMFPIPTAPLPLDEISRHFRSKVIHRITQAEIDVIWGKISQGYTATQIATQLQMDLNRVKRQITLYNRAHKITFSYPSKKMAKVWESEKELNGVSP